MVHGVVVVAHFKAAFIAPRGTHCAWQIICICGLLVPTTLDDGGRNDDHHENETPSTNTDDHF